MEADTRYGSKAAFTVEEARALSTRIVDVVHERDRLREEVQHLKLVMAELADLRQFLDEAPAGAMAVNSLANGHLTSARGQGSPTLPTPADTVDVAAPDPDPAEAVHDAASAGPQHVAETSAGVANAKAQRHTGEITSDSRPAPSGLSDWGFV